MPFDLQGARSAGYGDADIASFLGEQTGFDTAGAVKAGYTHGEIIPFLTERLTATAKQEALTEQPAQGDPMGSGFTETAQPPAPAEAGAGRGFDNPPLASKPQPKFEVDRSRRGTTEIPAMDAAGNPTGGTETVDTEFDPDRVGPIESFGRGWGESGAQAAKFLTAIPGGAVVAAEAVANAITGSNGTSWQDQYFERSVQRMQDAVDWYRVGPEKKQSILAKVAQSLGAMTQDLPQMISSGGLSAETSIAKTPGMREFLEHAVSRGFDAMRPVMVKSGAEKAQEVLDAGGTPEQAMKSALTSALTTGFQGAFPMSAEGNVLTRGATGFPVGVAQGEGARVIQNAADPTSLQRPFTVEGAVVEGATGAVAAGGLGHRAEPTRFARPAESVLRAESVDEAIEAARVAANPAPDGSMRAQMLAIRPLENRNAVAETAVRAEAAGGDRSRIDEPGGSVADRVGGDLQPVDAVAGEPVADRVEGGPVSRGVADAVGELTATTNPAGTVTVRGADKGDILKLLYDNGITSAVPASDGVLVGRSQAEHAQRLIADFQRPERIEPAPAAKASADEYAGPTMAEVSAVQDIPTTEKMRRAVELVGEKDLVVDETRVGHREAAGELTRPSPEDVVIRQRQRAEGERAQQQRRIDDENRTRADAELPDFGLTGSDRPADANPDQTPMFSRGNAPTEPFYSALAREVENIPAKSQGAEGWRAQVQGLIAKGKVKTDEVEWSGLNDWLKMQSGKVTREQIGEFLKSNGVQVKEVTLGGERAIPETLMRPLRELTPTDPSGYDAGKWLAYSTRFEEIAKRMEKEGDAKGAARMWEASRLAEYEAEKLETDLGKRDGSTKYSQYTLPGGTNYREVLLTLPSDVKPEDRGTAYARETSNDYRSSHWDEPNVLAHIRLNDRTDADGKKVLFVEELQSDWAQAGRKQGFKNEYEVVEKDGKYMVRNKDTGEYDSSEFGPMTFGERRFAEQQARSAEARGGIPKAPFVGKTDAWLSLALKRVIKMAADEGYDRVVFVNGEQSAARYDLSKKISKVEYHDANSGGIGKPDLKEPEGSGTLTAYDHDGKAVINQHMQASELENHIGKEAAKKLLESPPRAARSAGIGVRERTLEGLDLKVGGEGMKSFYDKIVPNVAKDVVRKLGGEGPREVTLPGEYKGRAFSNEAEPDLKQPGFDITPAMREKVAGGVPLFRRDNFRERADRAAEALRNQPRRGIERSAFEAAVAKAYGNEVGRALLRKRVIEPLADESKVPDHVVPFLRDDKRVYGFYDPVTDRTYAILSNLRPSMVSGLVLHEVGVHYGFEAMIGRDKFAQVMKRISVMGRAGHKEVLAARDMAREKAAAESQIPEETLAYLVQHHPEMGVVREVIARIKAFLFNKLGIGGARLSADDITMLARGAVAHAAKGDPSTRARDFAGDRTMFSMGDAAEEMQAARPVRRPYAGPGAKIIEGASNLMHDVYMGLAPMSAGEQKPQAAAQQFVNDIRVARHEWTKMSELLKGKFPKDQREKMWLAAEEENAERLHARDDPRYERPKGLGLDSLSTKQREAVQTMHEYSSQLWARAKAAGLVEGEGVPFWTPRTAVMIGENGAVSKVAEPGKKTSADGAGRNVFTTAPSAKHRNHEGLAESEAALKAKVGANAAYVKDILTMPLAMSRFEQAIAGRELINTIKDIGLATGKDLVNNSGGAGFFTLDHPAFSTARPRFVKDEVTGKMTAAVDQNGQMVFDRSPIFIDKSWEGPLKAVMSANDNKIYTGYMLLKSKAMSAIMYTPLMHFQVIFGRAVGYADTLKGGPFKTLTLYYTGHFAKKDNEFMRKMIGAGMVPIGEHNNMLDATDVAADRAPEGTWTDPNESWIGLAAKAVGNAAREGLGDKMKSGIDTAGDVWHNTLLWRRIGDLQAGIARDAYDKLVAKGIDPDVASVAAAHLANRYAGAIGHENMSKFAHMAANVYFFSKSFNAANIGTVKDAAFGTTAGLKALIRERATSAEQALKVESFLKSKARFGLARDLAYSIIAMNLATLWFQRDKDADWTVDSVHKGLSREADIAMKAYMNWKEHPTDLNSYDPRRFSGAYNNEPGKENRVFMGLQESGRAQYMRLPMGKVVEDLIGWTTEFAKTADAKKSPFVRALDIVRNKKDDFGTPIWDDRDPNFAHRLADAAMFLLGTHVPIEQAKAVKDIASGVATPLDKEKVAGNITGLTISQGHPGGPEAGVAADVERSVKSSQQHAMDEVRRLLKYGKADEAYERLEKSDLTAHEINSIVKRVNDPKAAISRSTLKKFNAHATEEERKRFEDVTQ